MSIQYIADSTGKTTGVFIPIEDWEKLVPYLKDVKIESTTPTKMEIIAGVKAALKEVKLHQEGKIQLKPARELLDEL